MSGKGASASEAHLEPRVRQQEGSDVVEAVVNVLADIAEIFVVAALRLENLVQVRPVPNKDFSDFY